MWIPALIRSQPRRTSPVSDSSPLFRLRPQIAQSIPLIPQISLESVIITPLSYIRHLYPILFYLSHVFNSHMRLGYYVPDCSVFSVTFHRL